MGPEPYSATTSAAVRVASELSGQVAALGDADARLEWAQALVNLGYAPAAAVTDTAHDLTTALDRYRLEVLAPDASDAAKFTSSGAAAGRPTEAEQHELEILTSLDGEGSAPQSSRLGSRGVWMRVLHHRLRALNLYDGDVAAPFNEGTRDALARIVRVLGRAVQGPGLLTLLGDAERLGEVFIREHGETPLVFRTAESLPAEGRYEALWCAERGFRSVREREVELGWKPPDQLQEFRRRIAARATVSRQRHLDPNAIGCQILQLRLWMFGYYKGRLDGWWGPITLQALRTALRVERVSESQALIYVGNGFYAANPRFLFRRFLADLGSHLPLEERASALITEGLRTPSVGSAVPATSRGSIQEQAKAEARQRSFLSRLWSGIKSTAKALLEVGSRIYTGVKTMVSSALRALQHGLQWVRDGIESLAAPAVNLFRFMLSRISGGVSAFATALGSLGQLVRGAPIITRSPETTQFVFSRHGLDFDAVLYASRDAPDDLLREHVLSRRHYAQQLDFALTIVSTTFRFLLRIATGPPGWVRLGFDLGVEALRAIRGRSRLLTPRPT